MEHEGMMATNGVNTAHKDIPGNPSTATSSKLKLADRENGESLRVLSEEDWTFWKHNGYVVIKTRYQLTKSKNWPIFYGNMKIRILKIKTPGIGHHYLK